MPKLPDYIREIGERCGLKRDDLWDCQGTWVVYHKALERVAAEQGIEWLAPQVINSDTENDVVVLATGKFKDPSGKLKDRFEWSFGEASSDNYPKRGKAKRYPWAMAEKRAKDRVILKLIGLAGLVYSEEESEDFKRSGGLEGPDAIKPPSKANSRELYQAMQAEMRQCMNLEALLEWNGNNKRDGLYEKLPKDWLDNLREEFAHLKESFQPESEVA